MEGRKIRAGLLGGRLTHSFSPRIHAKLTNAYAYDLFEIPPDGVPDFIRHGAWDALNVTIPYKKTVLPLMDALSETAAAVGSVNTVVRLPDGRLFGDNTDPVGFSALLDDLLSDPSCTIGTDLTGKKALVLGSGGASLTAQTVLRSRGAAVTVISRTGRDNYENLYDRHADAALLVNATPVGMYPQVGVPPVDTGRLPSLVGVIDMIYNPLRTRLMLDAADRGILCRNGLLMLTAQAAAASCRFLGQTPDSQAISVQARALCTRITRDTQHIVLVGMPGCGKTTVARALAARLGRTAADTDEEIVRSAGRSIPALFASEGESGFRRREADVIAALGRENGGTPGHEQGMILATGGGCVTVPENRAALRQNGTVVFLARDLSALAREGRPLSEAGSLSDLYARRLPLYRLFADVTVPNDGTVDETVDAILRALGLSDP